VVDQPVVGGGVASLLASMARQGGFIDVPPISHHKECKRNDMPLEGWWWRISYCKQPPACQ